MQRNNAGLFWPVLALVAAIDFGTKAIASSRLIPPGLPHAIYGREWIRFTLVHNPGAAFGLQMGNPVYSRWIFMVLTIVALVILGRLYTVTRAGDLVRTLSLALVCGGAMGNLIDRVRSQSGVVDFIDIGFGDSRWPTFNIADMAVSLGAFLLAWVLWGEDAAADRSGVSAPAAIASESGELS
jgi:signal peptidase II